MKNQRAEEKRGDTKGGVDAMKGVEKGPIEKGSVEKGHVEKAEVEKEMKIEPVAVKQDERDVCFNLFEEGGAREEIVTPGLQMYLGATMPGVPTDEARELLRQQLQNTVDQQTLKKLGKRLQRSREEMPEGAVAAAAEVDPRKRAEWLEQTRNMLPESREAALWALEKVDEQKRAANGARGQPVEPG